MADKSFEYGLTRKQTFFLYLSAVLPDIDLVHELWKLYRQDEDKSILEYHESISPFRPHPAGDTCLINRIAGIDHDMLLMYMHPRKCWLAALRMVGHPDFICGFKRKKEDISNCVNYFDTLLREEQEKLLPLEKVHILNRVIMYLMPEEQGFHSHVTEIMVYLRAFFNQYKNVRISHGYPLAVDSEGVLMRFE